VVDSNGEVVAIMTAYSPYVDATEIHFALPIDVVSEVVDSILNIGEMRRPYTGMRVLEMNPQIERAYSILNDTNEDGIINDTDRANFEELWGVDLNECLFVVWVNEDSTAGDSGIREGDILTEFNGVPVHNITELKNQIERYRINDRITIEWIRREYAVWDPYVADIVLEYSGQRDEEE
jgi:serine protease Do